MKYILVLIIFVASTASADIKTDIARCSGIDSDVNRLVCFDELASTLGVDKPQTNISRGAGKWTVREDKSPIDDSTNVYLSLSANESVKSRWERVRPSLHLRCAENKTNLFIVWNMYLGLDSTNMLVRFDKEKAESSEWYISTDAKAVFARRGHIGLAKRIMNHNQMLAQITPYGESPVMVTFDVSGLEEAIKPLRKACSW